MRPEYKYETEKKLLSDGIYDVSDVMVIYFSTSQVGSWTEPERHQEHPGIKAFMKDHPNFVVGQAYEKSEIYFLSKRPEEITEKVLTFGDGFNYGCCNLLTDLPKSILILAEDD